MSHAHPTAAQAHTRRAFVVAIWVNGLFVLVEAAAGALSGSLALLSDAAHNLSDVLALLLGWGAMLLGARAATSRHTYGYQRASIVAALASTLLLYLVLGGVAWEAIGRMHAPEAVPTGTVMAVAGVGVVVNGVSAWLLHRGERHDINRRAAFVHMWGDAAISAGVVLTGLAMQITGWLWLDPGAALVIVGLIIVGSWSILRESGSLMMDAVPSRLRADEVLAWLRGVPGVEAVHDLHIWALGTTETALTAHLVMPQAPADDAFLRWLDAELAERFGIRHATVQIERGNGDTACPLERAHGTPAQARG